MIPKNAIPFLGKMVYNERKYAPVGR
jgi:hypothetical protein